ncbi:hypothetical protein [Chryseobacterium luquanense]|uniref:Uncharacterized protein n=1 Tax=Chryseobacterium luquanense TaxID=2983766 RepID=A0ABT3Y706_9FLAO|nr:hypothetical protein [Chryseobacterium luquanense]MCX8533940.1 hypothetical protein [Chryseobacterium luquanense]
MRKIYYVPGLISALLMPVLLWYYMTPYIDFTVTNVIDIKLPSKDKNISINQEENNIGNFLPLKRDHYSKVPVSGNEAKKNSNLYVSEIRKLNNQNSENKGIEFVLDKNNTYGDFVSLLNDFHISKHEYYGIDLESGNLVASTNYNLPQPVENTDNVLMCVPFVEIVDFPQKNIWNYLSDFADTKIADTSSEKVAQLPKGSFPIIFGFLLFLNISMLSIKERFQLN